MKRKYRQVQTVKHYPKKIVLCSRCHREIDRQPFIQRVTLLTRRSSTTENICWKCVRDIEGCYLICLNYPEYYTHDAHNNARILRFKPPVSLFVEAPHGDI